MELFFTEVEIKLELEVGWEKEVDTRLLSKSSWEPVDSVVYLPFDLLAIVYFIKQLTSEIATEMNRLAHKIYRSAFVDSRDEIVGDFHHWLGVPAQVESLLRGWIDIPVVVFQILVVLILQQLMEEMESKLAFAAEFTKLFGVFVRF